MKVHNSIPLSKLATIPSLKTNISPLKIMGFQNKSPFSRGLFSGATWGYVNLLEGSELPELPGFVVPRESLPPWRSRDFFFRPVVRWIETDRLKKHLSFPETNVDVSENSGLSPQIIHFNRGFHYKPSILGYPYFWKHHLGKFGKSSTQKCHFGGIC